MGLKRWHKTDEMATIDMKMGWKSNSNKNNLKCYTLIQQHCLLLNMQNDLSYKIQTRYITPLEGLFYKFSIIFNHR